MEFHIKNFSSQNSLILLQIEVSEKIENKNLKNFISTNFELKNITLNKNDKIFINYIEELKKYQIFVLDENYDFFNFQVFEQFYKEESSKEQNSFDLYLCNGFFCLYKNGNFYYYQKLNQNIEYDELIEFLNKKFNLTIDNFKQIEKSHLEELKNSYLEKNYKQTLPFINLKKDYSFLFFVFYLFALTIFSFYIFLKQETKEQVEATFEVDIEVIKSKYKFQSFQEKLNTLSKDIDENSLVLQSLEFQQNKIKLILNSQNKDNLYSFLEKNSKTIISSSINFLEDLNIYEGKVNAKIFE